MYVVKMKNEFMFPNCKIAFPNRLQLQIWRKGEDEAFSSRATSSWQSVGVQELQQGREFVLHVAAHTGFGKDLWASCCAWINKEVCVKRKTKKETMKLIWVESIDL